MGAFLVTVLCASLEFLIKSDLVVAHSSPVLLGSITYPEAAWALALFFRAGSCTASAEDVYFSIRTCKEKHSEVNETLYVCLGKFPRTGKWETCPQSFSFAFPFTVVL